MKAKLAILGLLMCTSPALAQGELQKATSEEVLQASLSVTGGEENTYPLDISYATDPMTGDEVQVFTFTGPSVEVDAVIAQCTIRLEKEIGYDQDTGVIRAVSESVPVCGGQYTNMRDMIKVEEVTASFAIHEYVYQ